jgi:hypothetical protein
MKTIKSLILERINKIKTEENNFKSIYWNNNYVSYFEFNSDITKHISEVIFENLNDDDLVRLFEYILLCRADIVTNRVNQTYFNYKSSK